MGVKSISESELLLKGEGVNMDFVYCSRSDLIKQRLAMIVDEDPQRCQYGAMANNTCKEAGRFLLSYRGVTLFLCPVHFDEVLPHADG